MTLRSCGNWLGHILRREGENDCFTALGLASKGLRTRGKGQSGNKPGWKSWEVEKAVAEDRNRWSDSVEKTRSIAN